MQNQEAIRELAVLFLKLGSLAFGGPAAHTAMMESEVVRRRGWLTHQEFLDLMGATNLIPGPNSTELAIHIGHHRAGWPGLIVAGTCFILPAMLIVMAFGWLYVHYGHFPLMQRILYGVKPVVIAIIVQALWNLFKVAVKNRLLAGIGLIAVLAVLSGVHELVVLFGTALLVLLIQLAKRGARRFWAVPFVPVLAIQPSTQPFVPNAFGLWPLFFFFLKVGSVLFGSGYVLLAFLQADLVERFDWLTQQQLLDAIVVGQITPGPVFTTATFIGYILGGVPGAIVATVGIFLPAFVFVALSAPFIKKMRESALMGAFLDGLNVASLALMAVVTASLASSAITDVYTAALALGSVVLLTRGKVNPLWLVPIGAFLGFLAGLS
jgi:chromate transporter